MNTLDSADFFNKQSLYIRGLQSIIFAQQKQSNKNRANVGADHTQKVW